MSFPVSIVYFSLPNKKKFIGHKKYLRLQILC